jgi:phospholipid-binding lipoprotein MlaA
MKSKFLCGVVHGFLGLALSLSIGVRSASAQEISDPLEPMNRGVFWFNEKFDHYLLEPVSDGYRFIMPKRGRQAVEHFFANLRYPKQLVSNVVSGKFSRAGIDTARFLINSTLGLAGFFEVA